MNNLKLTWETKDVNPNDLKFHPMLVNLGLISNAQIEDSLLFLASESKYHGSHYDVIAATADRYILTHPEIRNAAIENGENTIRVDMINGLQEDDIIRFINAKSLFFRRNYTARWSLFRELKRYFKNTEKGKIWYGEIASELENSDINSVIGKITGYSVSSIKQIQKIGLYCDKNEVNLFDKIGYDEGQESLKSICDKIENNDPSLSEEKSSKFPTNNEEREKQRVKDDKERIEHEDAEKNIIELKGEEYIKVILQWPKENRRFSAVVSPAQGFTPEEAIYHYNAGVYDIEIRIKNVLKLFAA